MAEHLTEPFFTPTPEGYRVSWCQGEEWVYEARVTNLHQNGNSAIWGELSFECRDNDIPKLHGLAFNLLSTRGRTDIAKHLELLHVIPALNWTELVEQVCAGVVNLFRRGEPVEELWTSGEAKRPEYYLEPFIIKNYPSAIFGDPGSLKSNGALVFMSILTIPWHDNPIGLIAPSKAIKVLYLDWETDKDTVLWQLTKIQKGMGLPSLPIKYRRCSRPLAHDMEQIRYWIEECEADVIIGDSLGLAVGGDLKETQSALEFFAAFRELKTTGLFLAHNSKDREEKTKSIYGNMYYTAQMRNIWEIRKTQEDGSDEASIALFHRKPPPFDKTRSPVGFKFLFTDNTTKIEPEDPKTVGEFVKQMSLKIRLTGSLKHGKSTAKELSEELGTSEGTVRAELNRSKDLFVRAENGWGLLSKHA